MKWKKQKTMKEMAFDQLYKTEKYLEKKESELNKIQLFEVRKLKEYLKKKWR